VDSSGDVNIRKYPGRPLLFLEEKTPKGIGRGALFNMNADSIGWRLRKNSRRTDSVLKTRNVLWEKQAHQKGGIIHFECLEETVQNA